MSLSDRRVRVRIRALEANRAKAGAQLKPAYDRALELLVESADELDQLEKALEVEAAAHAVASTFSSDHLAASLRDIETRTSALLARKAPTTDLNRNLDAIERSKLLIDIRTREWQILRMQIDEALRAARDERLKALVTGWRRILDPRAEGIWRDAATDGLVIGLTQAGGPVLEILLRIRERALESQRSFDATDKHLADLAGFCAQLEDWLAASRAARMELESED